MSPTILRAARAPTCWCPTCRSARSRRPSVMPSRRWRPAAPSSTASRSSSPRDPDWRQRFEERGLPIIGDDIKSQVGATIVHRVLGQPVPRARRAARPHLPAQFRRQHRLPEHARARAAGVEEDLQDAGRRPASSTCRSTPGDIHVGPSDYVPWLTDRKWCLHPHGGHHLRRRAAERRAEARGVGFARTPPASSSMPCAAPSWRWTAASAAR